MLLGATLALTAVVALNTHVSTPDDTSYGSSEEEGSATVKKQAGEDEQQATKKNGSQARTRLDFVTPRREPRPFAALLSFCAGKKFADMAKLVNLNHKAYAARHGYDFIEGSDEVMPHMHFFKPREWLKGGWGSVKSFFSSPHSCSCCAIYQDCYSDSSWLHERKA